MKLAIILNWKSMPFATSQTKSDFISPSLAVNKNVTYFSPSRCDLVSEEGSYNWIQEAYSMQKSLWEIKTQIFRVDFFQLKMKN
jgi:hypothetical protein